MNAAEFPKVDSEFEEITEGEEEDRKQKLKTKLAAVEALVGSEKRIRLIAEDLVQHFERRLEAMDGKAMVVCMSRRICVDHYYEFIKLRLIGPAPRRRHRSREETADGRENHDGRQPDDDKKQVSRQKILLTGFVHVQHGI